MRDLTSTRKAEELVIVSMAVLGFQSRHPSQHVEPSSVVKLCRYSIRFNPMHNSKRIYDTFLSYNTHHPSSSQEPSHHGRISIGTHDLPSPRIHRLLPRARRSRPALLNDQAVRWETDIKRGGSESRLSRGVCLGGTR